MSERRRPRRHCLGIRDFRIWLYLGTLPEEQKAPQEIAIDFEITTQTPPNGMKTDALKDTICYREIAEAIRSCLDGQKIHLIENVGQRVYDAIAPFLAEEDRLQLSVRKLHPPLSGLKGGSYFQLEDM